MVENPATFYFYISPLRMESVQTADLDNRESNKVNKKLPTAPVMKELEDSRVDR